MQCGCPLDELAFFDGFSPKFFRFSIDIALDIIVFLVNTFQSYKLVVIHIQFGDFGIGFAQNGQGFSKSDGV